MTGLVKVAWGLVAVVGSVAVLFQRADRKAFLPGQTSAGHHQIEQKCESCHTPFGGVAQEKCVACHGEGLSASEDSHTTGKFEDPRNAFQLGRIDATHCVACHLEHRPGQTDRLGVSQRTGFCVECHRDVGRERATHADLAFSTCTNVGCHDFHDNRGLYSAFLEKHRGEPELLTNPVLPALGLVVAGAPAAGAANASSEIGAPPAAKAVAPDVPQNGDDDGDGDKRSPDAAARRAAATSAWEGSAHARAGVSCGGCHRASGKPDAAWSWRPDPSVACARCHEDERRTFSGGKHGMRLAVGLPPMRPSDAFVPAKMKPEARSNAHEAGLTCARCHDAHAPDLRLAAVETCEGCHDDGHTKSYRLSPHFARWRAELAGTGAAGTGVSCATCHLPRTTDRTGDRARVWVDHNQNGNLRPVAKMARSVCLSCHGLQFSLEALADPELGARNFNGKARPVRTGFDLLKPTKPTTKSP